jgi:Uncharacterised nucleotidyltransferase
VDRRGWLVNDVPPRGGSSRPAERAIILACAAGPSRAERVRQQLAEAGRIDWAYLIDAARRHQLLPLVSHALIEHCADVLPDSTLADLRGYSAAVSLRNGYMARAMIDIQERFVLHGIDAIPFKGPVLAQQLYANVALRQFGDLDVLIRPRNVASAVRLLIEAGYRLDPPLNVQQAAFITGLGAPACIRYLRSRAEHHFIRAVDNTTLDLHLALADPDIRFTLQFEELWRRRWTATLGASRVPSMSFEDTLLVLCLNGAKDGWRVLQRVADLAALLTGCPELDAEYVVRRARRLGALRMLRVGLLLAQHLVGIELPPVLANQLEADPVAARIARRVEAQLWQPVVKPRTMSLEYARAYLATRERLRDRLWFCASITCTPGVNDWRTIWLPESLAWLYYIVRPPRLISDYVVTRLRSWSARASKSRPTSNR